MLGPRTRKATILSFPSLWLKLVMDASVPQSEIITVVEMSKLHPLQVIIPPQAWSGEYPKSIRYKCADLTLELLRISQFAITTCGGCDTPRVYRAFRDHSPNQLRWLSLVTSPASMLDKLLVPYIPHLGSPHPSGVEFWPPSIAENITYLFEF